MHDSRHYTDQAQRFARLAAEAQGEPERDAYHRLAAGYLQLAKDAAAIEMRQAAPAGSDD